MQKDYKLRLWLVLGAALILGVLGGAVGAAFSFAISLVTSLRQSNDWLIFLLPACGLITVFLYKRLKLLGVGTNTVLLACENEEKLSPRLSVGVFLASVFSHLCGASVGREGAALQLGGSLSSAVSKILRLNPCETKILLRAGMSAVFAAVFGTPLAAFFFALEIVTVGILHVKSAIPCFFASFSGYFTALFLGAHPERFNLTFVPEISLDVGWKAAVITILTALLSIVFCYALKYSQKLIKRFINDPYLRIIGGGLIIVFLTTFLKNQDYNGAGVNIIEHIFENGTFRPEAFILKLIFTCICVAAGYKGGEIVPTLFIGATFGALLASVLGLPVAFGAALGMIALFCGVTNCPLASLFLGIELFSGVGVWYFIPSVALCYLISGKISLYSAQKHKFKYI